ncbi:hypothetical protein ABTM50_19585, partial [Acinetobacter baumannii]
MPGAAHSNAPMIPSVPVTADIVDRLRAIVGDKGLLLEEHDKQPFVPDGRGARAGHAGAVVRPATTAEVSAVVKLCHDNGIAIVPQG